MPKKRKPVLERAPSKLQLSKWERQKRLQRVVVISGIFIIAAVLGIISFGYYDYKIKPTLAEKEDLAQAAFRVNDKVFTNETLIKTLVFFGIRQPSFSPSIPFLDSIVEYMQNAEIIAQEAQKLNINVAGEEIDQDLRKSFTGKDQDFTRWYDANLELNGLTDEEFRQLLKNELLSKKFRDENITPTVPGEEMQVQVERILVRTEEEASQVVQRLQSGTAFADLVKELSQDPASKEKDGNTGWTARDDISKAFDEIAFKLKKGEISQPVFDDTVFVKGGYWIVKVIEKQEDKVKLDGILLRTEAEARPVKARLDAGEDFTGLAKELSLDLFAKETGGEIGELVKGAYGPEFDNVAFSLEPGQWGGPVFDSGRTIKGGYWVLRAVEEPQMRALEKAKLDARQQEAFNKWLEEKKKDYRLENYLNQDQDKKTALLLKAASTIVLKQAKAKAGR